MSSIKSGLRRAGIVGLSTLVAGSMMTFSAVTAQADWATGGGDIGLVDTNTPPPTVGTQGATLVTPGVAGQALGDMRILVPNLFKSGDTIDLTIFDRTATITNPGDINANVDHRLSFTSAPEVTVSATPVVFATNVGPTEPTPGDTENSPVAAAATVATTAPLLTTTLKSSSRGAALNPIANDIIRLTVGNQSGGTDTTGTAAKWIITVHGVTADLGPSVSPGELRVVPFAYNGAPNTTNTNFSTMFGNVPDQSEVPPLPQVYNPVIKLYTVPAYVAPVIVNVGNPSNIVADDSVQTVGDITIAETNTYSMQPGSYTVTIGGTSNPVIANDTVVPAKPVTVTATNPSTGETVTSPAVIGHAPETLTFTLGAGTTNTKLTVTLKGLLLKAGNKGTLTYGVSGGSIDQFMASPAGTSPAIGTPPEGVAADTAFVTVGGAINQLDIRSPGLPIINAAATPTSRRIGGIDRYQTAEKIALAKGPSDVAVLASGENFPDALSSAYLANTEGASILLTKSNELPASTLEGLRLLGTHTVYLIGGTGAISAAVEAQLRNTSQYYVGGEVTIGQGKLLVVRLGGSDRYATNKVVNLRAAALTTAGNPVGRTALTFGQSSKLTALVATGDNALGGADALAGGPATIGNDSGKLPLILTPTGALTSSASSQMTALGIQQAVILGGPGAVSPAVESAITAMGAAVERIGGADRYATATMIADFEVMSQVPTASVDGPDSGLGFAGNHVFLARGDIFADALAGGPLAGGQHCPLLLTNSTTLSTATGTWLKGHASSYDYVTALGLGGAVSQPVLDAANVAIGG